MYSQVSYPTPTTAVLTITDAGPLNVLSTPVIHALTKQLGELAENQELRCLVLRGSGSRAFIAGADIKELATLTAATGRVFIGALRDLCNAVRHFPVPVIVRLEGHTLGGGLELAMAGDLRIAADDAVVGMPEVKVGIPSVVEAALLPRLIGWGRTSWLLLTGDNIDAAKAEAWGLVEIVVPEAKIDAAIEHCVQSIAQEATPLAVRAQKRLMRRWERLPLDEAVQAGIDSFAQSVAEGEHIERMGAFVNRKKK